MLSCDRLSFQQIVRDVSLRVEPGECVALIGPNGAGKSTILKLLARVLTPTGGAVSLFGHRLHRMRARKRARWLGYLPQQTVVDVAYTVRDIVEMGFYAQGAVNRDASDLILAQVGLQRFADRDIRTLSGGECQRAFLGKVLAQNASILLLDEPVSGLDAGFQLDILRICRALVKDGRGILVTLHDLEHVLSYADRVILLHEGTIIGQGRPVDVLTGSAMERAFGLQTNIFVDPYTKQPRLSFTRIEDPQNGGMGRTASEQIDGKSEDRLPEAESAGAPG